MFMLDDYSHEAPLIDLQEAADRTDLYACFDTDDADSGARFGNDADVADAVLRAEDAAGANDGTNVGIAVSVDPEFEDAFFFLSIGPGNGSAVPDSSTPAPEEEEPGPPELGFEWEMQNLTSARHTATGAMLRAILSGSL